MSAPRVLIDCNVLIDLFCQRPAGQEAAAKIWDGNRSKKIDGHLTATSVLTIEYVIQKARRKEGDSEAEARDQALTAVRAMLKAFRVLPTGWYELDRAKNKTGDDYEDNVQIACAEHAEMDLIVTNDAHGFTHSAIPALSAAALVARYGL